MSEEALVLTKFAATVVESITRKHGRRRDSNGDRVAIPTFLVLAPRWVEQPVSARQASFSAGIQGVHPASTPLAFHGWTLALDLRAALAVRGMEVDKAHALKGCDVRKLACV